MHNGDFQGRTETGTTEPLHAALMRRLPRRRLDPMGEHVVQLVSERLDVTVEQLFAAGRCSAIVARARQIAMYLMHVELGRNYAEVGRCFGRDRTTVSHACMQIEDLREAADFDAEIDRIEQAIRALAPGEVADVIGA